MRKLVDRLMEAGAAQVILDIDFSAASNPEDDRALAAALQRAGDRVILPVFQQRAERQSDEMVQSFPLAAFAERARIASVNIRADRDGIVREMPQLEDWGGQLVPTLATAASGVTQPKAGAFFIDYGIRAEDFQVFSYVDFLNGRVPRGLLTGKMVFVGSTALELGDIAATPVNSLTPGTIVQALATSSLLQDRALHKVAPGPILVLTVILFVAVGSSRRRQWWTEAGIGVAWAVGVFALSVAVQAVVPIMID